MKKRESIFYALIHWHIFQFALLTLMMQVGLAGQAGARQRQSAKVIRVACVGNSITYGLGIRDSANDCYPAQLQRMLGPGFKVGNFGKSGATLLRHGHRPYFEQREFRDAMNFKGDIAVIHLGINDTDPRDWPNYRDEFVGDYLALIDSLKQANPHVRIIIARLTPIRHDHWRFISGTKLWHDEIQEAIATVAKLSGAELIDFHAPLYPYPNYSIDGIHPNPTGARLLAKTVYSGITGDYGGLRMSPIYTDYMVLQSNVPLDIRGTANAGSLITVTISGRLSNGSHVNKTATALTNQRGEWTAILPPMNDTKTDYTLTVTCKDVQATKENRTNHDLSGDGRYGLVSYPAGALNSVRPLSGRRGEALRFSHVAVGEVWLCSGQSNMEFQLRRSDTGKRDIPQANDSCLRLFDMKGRWGTDDVVWPLAVLDSIDRLEYFTSTAWRPCTPVSAKEFSAVAYYFGRMLRDSLQVPVGLICNAVGGSPAESWIDRNTLETQFPAILRTNFEYNDFIQPWVRERALENVDADTTHLRRHPYMPAYCYEAGILPIAGFPIKGVIWYQGESNAHNYEAHEQLFRLLVNSWRSTWHQEKLPFYYVQLSSINRPSWPWFRDSQRRLMDSIPYTGMAVSSDWGNATDVHPRHKEPIGQRLALWALNKTYGHHCIPSGPLANGMKREGDTLVVNFRYGQGLKTSDGKAPRTFEIAHDDGMFYPATVVIEEDHVRLSSPKVKDPVYVRYGWQPFTLANLVNGVGLPASTFRLQLSNLKQ